MIKRIIDISERSYLHLSKNQLLIDQEGETVGQLPIEDIGMLILQHFAIVISQQLILACQKNNVAIVFADERHLPYSIILPIGEANSLHNKILKQQIATTLPVTKNLWKQTVKAKIAHQIQTLQSTGVQSKRLATIQSRVKSGDAGNCEALAAQIYWKLLFGNDFRRNADLEGINSLLNYGYSIIRAMVARAICAAGLHPAIGLFHKNQYNSLCLADDLMEPFRPWVDLLVYNLNKSKDNLDIDQSTKTPLLELLTTPVIYENKTMPFMVSCHYLMANLKRCYNKEIRILNFPTIK